MSLLSLSLSRTLAAVFLPVCLFIDPPPSPPTRTPFSLFNHPTNTPTALFLQGCWDHFRSWTRSHAVLSTLVRNAINQRLVTDVDIVPPHILPDTIKAWTSALSQLLTHTSKLRLPAADALALPLFQHNTSSSSASSSSARSPPPLSAPTFLSPLRISFLSSSLPAATSSPPPALPHPRSSTALPISPPLSLSSSAASNTSTADARSPLSSPDFAPQKRDQERVGMRGGRVRVRGALGQRKKEALERSSSALLLLASEEQEHEQEHEHEQRSGSLLRVEGRKGCSGVARGSERARVVVVQVAGSELRRRVR
eukprot:2830287-Rhodomonas_salina.2